MVRSERSYERGRPLLGTFASIRVGGLERQRANAAIEEGFEAIEKVEERMSFHRPHSELSRLNRWAHLRPMRVSRALWTVLEFALRVSAETEGLFDVTVAPALVRRGLLPAPDMEAEPCGTWQDIELSAEDAVFFRRPLWIDLGGVAKGYAVDRCAEVLMESGVESAVINAGGDLRVVGNGEEQVALRVDDDGINGTMPVMTLADGSLASSCTTHSPNAHIEANSGMPLRSGLFACVASESCMAADALTKVVLTDPRKSVRALRRWGGQAHFRSSEGRWSEWK